MNLDLFSIPVFIGDIDSKKINLNNKKFKKTWLSQMPSTYEQSNTEKQTLENGEYLLKTIGSLLKEKIKHPFQLSLTNIWENSYVQDDFQEPHIHENCDFSFIIYKKVKEGKTVFFNPIKNYLLFYKNISDMFDGMFMPRCKKDQIIVFPSFLEHMVLKSTDQITISGNLIFTKK
tara:strand:+ start:197 stop:721 length:525 start_codon:yes stop_codon:yes gene_type:complete